MIRTLAPILLAIAATLAACGGDDANEGKPCQQANDCGGNLTCQPVQGRNQDFCCPTPAAESNQDNCHAVQ